MATINISKVDGQNPVTDPAHPTPVHPTFDVTGTYGPPPSPGTAPPYVRCLIDDGTNTAHAGNQANSDGSWKVTFTNVSYSNGGDLYARLLTDQNATMALVGAGPYSIVTMS
jgi:hypothetical protein